MKLVTIFTLIAFLFVGCALMSGLDPQSLKTPHARSLFVNKTYTMAWEDYQRYAVLENLRPEAVTLLKAKRMILANLHLPIAVLNGHAEVGNITDAMFNELLGKLAGLEEGWYTTSSQAQANVDRTVVVESSIVSSETSAQMDPIFMGILLELLKSGIHAWRAIQQQRHFDAEQLATAWQESFDKFKTLDITQLVTIQ